MSANRRGFTRAASGKAQEAGGRAGKAKLPIILQSDPREGDVHHVTPSLLEETLRAVPERYHRDLESIDLLPRRGEIGRPYGSYDREGRRIVLFSAPAQTWSFDRYEPHWSYGFKQWGASVKVHQKGLTVHWRSGTLPCFYVTVFCHQLAQHYNQWIEPDAAKSLESATNENLADFHSLKLLLMTSPTFLSIKEALETLCARLQAEK